MKFWIDRKTPAPIGYVRAVDIQHAKAQIAFREGWTYDNIDCISIGDEGIEFLEWLEKVGYNYPIHIHSQDAVGIEKMREIIKRNGWKEV